MNICDFETAKKLKEIGFPQPDFLSGQIWYDDVGNALLICRELSNNFYREFQCIQIGKDYAFNVSLKKESHTFSPTATDLLKELPCHDLMFVRNRAAFCCWLDVDRKEDSDFFHANPAEACAEAYFLYCSLS